MSPFQLKLKQIEEYQKKIGSKKTFLYEAFVDDYRSNSSTTILADTDEEAIYIAKLLNPNFVFIQQDHWGLGPKIMLKSK